MTIEPNAPPDQPIGHMYCNDCAAPIYFPERGILPFDGRFCDHDCKHSFELKRAGWTLRNRR